MEMKQNSIIIDRKMDQGKNKSKKTFSFDKVDGIVKLTKTVEIPPINTMQVFL